MAGKVKHKLQELLYKKELEIGGRKSLSYHAKQMRVSKRTLERWLDTSDPTGRFDKEILEKFCAYFDVGVGDILYYVPEEAEDTE